MIREFLDINNAAFSLIGYDISWLELLGTAFGLWCVWLTAKDKWTNWPIGIINIVLFFLLFWQIRLYSDMFLQILFLVASFIGWYKWLKPDKNQADPKGMLKISFNSSRTNFIWFLILIVGTLVWTQFIINVNLWFPEIFPEPAAYPYWDALTTVGSMIAITLQAKKKMESWYVWIACDIVDFVLYLFKGTLFLGLEYLVFIGICIIGLIGWWKEYKGYDSGAIPDGK